MTEQLTTNNVEGDQRGIDRRKFLLRTTAVTAGAWAAPSILTIDKAFGTHGSPHCPCDADGTAAYWVDGFMVIPALGIDEERKQGCLNDDHLQEGAGIAPIGSFTGVEAECGCSARANVTDLEVDFPSDDIVTADVLQSHAECTCNPNGGSNPSGGSQVAGVTINGSSVTSNTSNEVITAGPLTVILNEEGDYTDPNSGLTYREFTALHVIYKDPLGNHIDLKFASSRVICS